MKFGKYLDTHRRTVWADDYLDYSLLKRTLKQVLQDNVPLGKPSVLSLSMTRRDSVQSPIPPQERFFRQLVVEVDRIDKFTQAVAQSQRAALRELSERLKGPDIAYGSTRKQLLLQAKLLGEEYLHLEKYVNVNYAALQKILKKHDKMIPSAPCWHFYKVHVSQQPWVRGDYHDIQVSLSRMMSQLHSAVLKGASQQQQEQQRLSMDLAAAAAAGQGPDLINLDPEMAAAASVAAISAAASAVSGWGEDVYGGGGGGREGASGGARSTGGGGSESDALPFNSLGGHERWECFTRKFWVRLEDLAEVTHTILQHLPVHRRREAQTPPAATSSSQESFNFTHHQPHNSSSNGNSNGGNQPQYHQQYHTPNTANTSGNTNGSRPLNSSGNHNGHSTSNYYQSNHNKHNHHSSSHHHSNNNNGIPFLSSVQESPPTSGFTTARHPSRVTSTDPASAGYRSSATAPSSATEATAWPALTVRPSPSQAYLLPTHTHPTLGTLPNSSAATSAAAETASPSAAAAVAAAAAAAAEVFSSSITAALAGLSPSPSATAASSLPLPTSSSPPTTTAAHESYLPPAYTPTSAAAAEAAALMAAAGGFPDNSTDATSSDLFSGLRMKSVPGAIVPEIQEEKEVEGDEWWAGEIITSLYLDNPSLELYHAMLYGRPYATSLKVQWRGVRPLGAVRVVRQVCKEGWRFESSVQDSFPIQENKVAQYLAGTYTWAEALKYLQNTSNGAGGSMGLPRNGSSSSDLGGMSGNRRDGGSNSSRDLLGGSGSSREPGGGSSSRDPGGSSSNRNPCGSSSCSGGNQDSTGPGWEGGSSSSRNVAGSGNSNWNNGGSNSREAGSGSSSGYRETGAGGSSSGRDGRGVSSTGLSGPTSFKGGEQALRGSSPGIGGMTSYEGGREGSGRGARASHNSEGSGGGWGGESAQSQVNPSTETAASIAREYQLFKTFTEVQRLVETKKLQPIARVTYCRTEFQSQVDHVGLRLELEHDVQMLLEYSYDAADRIAAGMWRQERPADAIRLPYAVLKVHLHRYSGEDESPMPAWLSKMMDSPTLLQVNDFAKYLHSCAGMLPDMVRAVPHWIDDPLVQSSFFQNVAANQELQAYHLSGHDVIEELEAIEEAEGEGEVLDPRRAALKARSLLARGGSFPNAGLSNSCHQHPLYTRNDSGNLGGKDSQGRRNQVPTANGYTRLGMSDSEDGSVRMVRSTGTATLIRAFGSHLLGWQAKLLHHTATDSLAYAPASTALSSPWNAARNERMLLNMLGSATLAGGIAAGLLGFSASAKTDDKQDPILHITECTALSLLAMAVALAGYGLASYLHKNAQLIVPAGRILITLRRDVHWPAVLTCIVVGLLSLLLVLNAIDFWELLST